MPIDPNIQAPELLLALFKQGAALLLASLPAVLEGGERVAWAQEEGAATHAPKVRLSHSYQLLCRESATGRSNNSYAWE